MAQKYGKTWWGQKWLQALNNIDYSNRLPRGASYARKGAVKKIDISENRIHAKVAGSRPSPYKVDIILPPFYDPERKQFMDAVANKPFIVSKLLNRDLDPSLLEMAEHYGLKVFPRQWTDFKMQCSCPDWAVPCKHLASVVYKVSEEIDNNPFLVFDLHILDIISELNIRGIYINTQSVEIPELTDFYFEKGKKKVKTTNHNFDNQNAYKKLSYSTLSPLHEPLSTLLAESPVFYTSSANFKEKYYSTLLRVVKNGQKILQGKISFTDAIRQNLSVEDKFNTHSVNKVIIDENFKASVYVNDLNFSVKDFMAALSLIPSHRLLDYQPSTASLHTIFNLALHLTANGAIVPQIVVKPNKLYAIRWLPALISKDVRTLAEKMSEILPPDIFLWKTATSKYIIEKETSKNLLSAFITEIVELLSGEVSFDLFHELFFNNKEYAFIAPGEGSAPGGIQTWLQKYYFSQGKLRLQIIISESINDSFIININVTGLDQYADEFIGLDQILSHDKFIGQRFEVLQIMATMSELIPGLDKYIHNKGDQFLSMDIEEFTPFLLQMVPVIRLLDIDILLPKSLQKIFKPKPTVKLKAKQGKSFLSLTKMLDFDWKIAIGDTLMDEEEFKKLLHKSDQLVKYKAQYFYINKDDLEKLHKHFSSEKELDGLSLLRVALSGEYKGARISMDSDGISLIRELTEVKDIPLPIGIKAHLRPYQLRGYSWMYRNSKIGFGSVIADDMGLGKTLQVITTILKYKEDGFLDKKKVLVVAPTGLLTNWQSEIEKFAPSLEAFIFHGANRKLPDEFDILLTSYGIVRSEAKNLKKLDWHTLVIDEAQNIKNNYTEQSKAIKTIKAENFIAMNGTPVENRLSELWSIMDFTNRGYLGNEKHFKEEFSNPIEAYNDIEVATKLKNVTAPFLMRRLKSDKSIISDLPGKIEIDAFCTLAKEQASLYEKTLEEAMNAIEAINPGNNKELFQRQGLVLQMILALKQICNHPTHFLKNNKLDASLSGKMDLLFEKLDTILDNGEKVLVFTQFKEMGDLLKIFIEDRYKEKPLFYHGGCGLKQRKDMVLNFQTNPADKIFILSLRAAGTGLNLTAANHVIHYDLWWNPAVEAQATDRAYRIGQKSNVMVHRFITKNTFEERINEMIQAKKALAEMTVATGENWIGNLSNKELKAIFEIR